MKKRKYAQGFLTSVEVDDVEYAVEVHYDSSGPEPDVNWAGGVEIESVIHRSKIASRYSLSRNKCRPDARSDSLFFLRQFFAQRSLNRTPDKLSP